MTSELMTKWATTENAYFTDQDEDLLLYKSELVKPMYDLLVHPKCVKKTDILKILKNYSEYVFTKVIDLITQNEFDKLELIETDNKAHLELIVHLKELKTKTQQST